MSGPDRLLRAATSPPVRTLPAGRPRRSPGPRPRGPGRAATAAICAALTAAVLAAGCLDPLADDGVAEESLLLASGATVPALETDAALAAQVDAADGVDRLVPRFSAFVDGERVWYWSFGPAPPLAIPIYYLVAADGTRLEHPGIVDAVPGDPGYSPFWRVYEVPVTATYARQRIPSFAALQEARRLGLVDAPRPTDAYVNCPIVHSDVRLDRGPGEPPETPGVLYYEGFAASVFGFGPVLPLEYDGRVPTAPVYVLRRVGGEPLSEPLRGVDMTGDGDALDSNNVFAVGRESPGYTPLWQVVEVVVPHETRSIDSEADETEADVKAAGDLFEGEAGEGAARPGHVVAVYPQDLLLNCPLQAADGGL